ncbi:leucyl aminopeptidase [Dietzia natronolimnaea]|uniref:Probable cytosol aminopeptidase n=1 Tax=Dietzia natronolimnaea TaxID=161920 RepID=A0A2A2WPL5_9ACTN|nr:M17 family metallopeptidase [Dietzia natronolimnaea]PAY23146.1 leucyl aminopeptidase [Dietzia natronolimnaea]
MPEIPSRPLPTVRVVGGSEAVDGWPLATRPATKDGYLRGRPAEARTSVVDGRPVVEVEVDASSPRPGWAGTVDVGIGYRRAGAAVARHLRDTGRTEQVTVAVPGVVPVDRLGDLVLGYLLGARGQDVFAADPTPVPPALVVRVSTGTGTEDDDEEGVRAAVAAAEDAARATALARDLAGAPADLKTPAWLVAQMADVLSGAGMRTRVLEGDELVEGGFGGVLAVGGGSAASPRVLVARRPGPGTRVLLVGKGITFDTGGISVKPADGMNLMRTDMAGSAAVVAAAASYCADASERYADLDVTVVVPSAENMLSGSAYRPGDVVTHVGGTTSEVTNTDAEGRMVLADALVHGIAESDPDVVVDVATLTGAMKVALGMRTGAVMATDDDLADRVSAAGAGAGERWWRLPLPDDLRRAVDSGIADRRQAPTGPGAITAALFLEGFVDGRPWAHLDIAGPARSPEEIDEVGPVATGFATRTLVGLLRDLADRPRR